MFSRIEKYLKERVDDIVFIHLKDDKSLQVKDSILDSTVPLPIPLKEVVSRVKEEEQDNEISILKIIQGMVYIIGIDSEFKYNETYKKFLTTFDKDIFKFVLEQAIKLTETGHKVEALICFKACCYIKRNDLDSLYNYARCSEELAKEWSGESVKDFEDEAVEVFENLVEIHPDFPLSYYHLGFHYVNRKFYKKAEVTWDKCLELGVDENKEMEILNKLSEISYKIQYEEGYNLVLSGRPQEGLEKLLPLEEKYPEWWNLQFFIGLSYRYIMDFEEALKYFLKAHRIKPSQTDILNEIGLCNISLGRTMEAIKYFKRALNIKNEDPEILCNLGIAYIEDGNIELANKYVSKSLEINPDDEITNAWMKKIKMMSSQ